VLRLYVGIIYGRRFIRHICVGLQSTRVIEHMCLGVFRIMRVRTYVFGLVLLSTHVIGHMCLGWFTKHARYQTYVQNLSIDNSFFYVRY